MIIGALLILTWLVLLLRYPAKALPISLAAVGGLGLVALFASGRTLAKPRNWPAWTCALPMPPPNAPPTAPCRSP